MAIELYEARWSHEGKSWTLTEIAAQSALTAGELQELIEYGVLVPAHGQGSNPSFGPECVSIARLAYQFRIDFDVDPDDLGFIFSRVWRIRELESELSELRARLLHAGRS